jgi:hypothetical protein
MLVRAWNVWRDDSSTIGAWVGNAGMLIEDLGDSRVRLCCSDGFGEPTFDDLVVDMRVAGRRLA